jgi:hypothetical protein
LHARQVDTKPKKRQRIHAFTRSFVRDTAYRDVDNYPTKVAWPHFIFRFFGRLLPFGALGWDVDNTNGLLEQYREVIYEDQLRIGGTLVATINMGGVFSGGVWIGSRTIDPMRPTWRSRSRNDMMFGRPWI